jgi:hypothetical protein
LLIVNGQLSIWFADVGSGCGFRRVWGCVCCYDGIVMETAVLICKL